MHFLLLDLILDDIGLFLLGILVSVVHVLHFEELFDKVLGAVARIPTLAALSVRFLTIQIILEARLVLLDIDLANRVQRVLATLE
mmetsp:Transcript_37960/g.49864  ORF Transcript_37960/g.49864 Transcript_37960/m.49864 type:complete len:85 (+) Transcript_37960:217-471(+)